MFGRSSRSVQPGSETEAIIDTSVSPAVDPMVADAIADQFVLSVGTDGKPVHHAAFTSGRGVLDTLHQSSLAMAQAERDIKAAGMNDPATTDRMRRAAKSKMDAARKAVETGVAALTAHRDQVEAGIVEALGIPTARVDVNEAGRASDIRAYLRGLPERQRSEAIRKAIADGDASVAAAVLSASPLASGIDRRSADAMRGEAELKFAGDAVRLRDSIDRMRGLVDTAMGATEKRFARWGFGNSAAAKAAQSLAALEGGAANG